MIKTPLKDDCHAGPNVDGQRQKQSRQHQTQEYIDEKGGFGVVFKNDFQSTGLIIYQAIWR